MKFCFFLAGNNSWIYKSRVALLEHINVLRHQVFVVLNSHKMSLFLCDLVIHFIDMPLGSDCAAATTNYEECLHRNE